MHFNFRGAGINYDIDDDDDGDNNDDDDDVGYKDDLVKATPSSLLSYDAHSASKTSDG